MTSCIPLDDLESGFESLFDDSDEITILSIREQRRKQAIVSATRRLDPVLEAVADEEAAVFIFPKAQQLADVSTLVDAHSDVQFVVDHMAWPDETTDPDEAPWTDFEALADRSNVVVKVSSLPRSSQESWPYRDLWGYVRNLVSWFGVERLLLGSDYPWMDDWATYEECLTWIDEVDLLSSRDRRYLRGDTFRRHFGDRR